MTPAEIEREINYQYLERIGMLCEDHIPTPEEEAIAKAQCDEYRARHTKKKPKILTQGEML